VAQVVVVIDLRGVLCGGIRSSAHAQRKHSTRTRHTTHTTQTHEERNLCLQTLHAETGDEFVGEGEPVDLGEGSDVRVQSTGRTAELG
jgi:hypothetical protein